MTTSMLIKVFCATLALANEPQITTKHLTNGLTVLFAPTSLGMNEPYLFVVAAYRTGSMYQDPGKELYSCALANHACEATKANFSPMSSPDAPHVTCYPLPSQLLFKYALQANQLRRVLDEEKERLTGGFCVDFSEEERVSCPKPFHRALALLDRTLRHISSVEETSPNPCDAVFNPANLTVFLIGEFKIADAVSIISDVFNDVSTPSTRTGILPFASAPKSMDITWDSDYDAVLLQLPAPTSLREQLAMPALGEWLQKQMLDDPNVTRVARNIVMPGWTVPIGEGPFLIYVDARVCVSATDVKTTLLKSLRRTCESDNSLPAMKGNCVFQLTQFSVNHDMEFLDILTPALTLELIYRGGNVNADIPQISPRDIRSLVCSRLDDVHTVCFHRGTPIRGTTTQIEGAR